MAKTSQAQNGAQDEKTLPGPTEPNRLTPVAAEMAKDKASTPPGWEAIHLPLEWLSFLRRIRLLHFPSPRYSRKRNHQPYNLRTLEIAPTPSRQPRATIPSSRPKRSWSGIRRKPRSISRP